MVLDYFIIYTHATHEKRRLILILPTKAQTHAAKEKKGASTHRRSEAVVERIK